MIEFIEVTKYYGQKPAVRDLTLEIPAGQLFALLGPNGAGKTTSIKMLVGLLHPSSGKIRVGGHDVVQESRQANQVLGYVPDEPYLYEKLTGREFLQFVAEMHGLSRSDARARIDRATSDFELQEFLDDLCETYSHGMKQRLAFASAMLHDPKACVVDEPMVGLDPRSARLVKDLLRRKADQGMAILMSTHTLAVVEEIADQIGIVHQGRLRVCGSMKELRRELAEKQMSLERMFLELTNDTAPRNGAPHEGRSHGNGSAAANAIAENSSPIGSSRIGNSHDDGSRIDAGSAAKTSLGVNATSSPAEVEGS